MTRTQALGCSWATALSLLALAPGCEAFIPAEPSLEVSTIRPIRTRATAGEVPASPGEDATKPSADGLWLWRTVATPRADGNGRALGAIEILYCPHRDSPPSTCRVGVAWERGKNPLGTVRAR